MTSKSTDAYKSVFNYIENNIFELKATSFMTDFESSMRAAINLCYPNADLYGCWYHFKAAVRRRCLQEGLSRMTKENPFAQTIYRMLLNLPLLPPESIEAGYKSIVEMAQNKNLLEGFKHIFLYFQNFWLRIVSLFSFIIFHCSDGSLFAQLGSPMLLIKLVFVLF